MSRRPQFTDEEALQFHEEPVPGKLSVTPTKPMGTQRDLSLAYSPGVAVPVEAIAEDEDLAYDYTSKGNMVAVISNGTAILGLGDLGPMASKPVMEGKSVLFKRFADIDSIDVEVETKDAEEFITVVKNIGRTYGGINLEDIKAPECFEIESRLREELDIPVFHDDQHGTAIIAAAGLKNACELTGRKLEDVKVVVAGAGAAGISVAGLIKQMGVKSDNVIMCDSKGVIHKGRDDLNQMKSAFAIDTPHRLLEEAMVGADCFLGLSVKGMVSKDMVKSMADNPIIFAMANPDPEITPEEVKEVRSDAIMATGRSDYPNQVNNVLGFPYIFRGALDVRARTVNEEMKIACVEALAELAKEDVPDEVAAAYHGARPQFGPDYIIPSPFDPRLISYVPPFVAQAAMDTGVARKPMEDMEAYRASLAQRLDPSASMLQSVQNMVRNAEGEKRIVFAEGEEPAVIRAAHNFQTQGLGKAILIGREGPVKSNMRELGVPDDSLEIVNAALSDRNPDYFEHLYGRICREGYLRRDVQRLVNNNRNIFGASMVALGDADGMVTGVTRAYDVALRDIRMVIDTNEGDTPFGMSIVIMRGRTFFIADTNVNEFSSVEMLADTAIETAKTARSLGFLPRVAFVSYSTFGNLSGGRSQEVKEAVKLLDDRVSAGQAIDFEYEGEISAEMALNPMQAKMIYPFYRLSGPANVLIMPTIHSASIATSLLQAAGGATVIGPLLRGLSKPIQIAGLGAPVNDITTLATFAAHDLT